MRRYERERTTLLTLHVRYMRRRGAVGGYERAEHAPTPRHPAQYLVSVTDLHGARAIGEVVNGPREEGGCFWVGGGVSYGARSSLY